jgi:integrase
MGKLTDAKVKAAKPGKYGDGDGLTLVVSETGAKKWVLRYQLDGKRRDMGLGPYPEISLSAARLAAVSARAVAAQGSDPLAARDAARKAARPVPTFGEVAREVIAEAQARTANEKVRYQVERHLGPAYCKPLLDRPVNEITTVDVAAVLRPVWRTKPEVARKLYPAIRRVFEAARIRLRDENGINFANPALWADLKAMGFEAPQQLTRGRHPSLPYMQMPEFMAALREREAVAARMLEFLILTNVRSGAARAATFDQFDLEAGVWSIPVANLKDKKTRKEPFRVPLSPRAAAIVKEMEAARVSQFVFPSPSGKAFSDMATVILLKRMNSGETKWTDPADGRTIVAHGFRATFKTWCEETAHFPHSIVEEAMGHVVGGAVERAYRRTDVLEHRRKLMEAWANHCEPKAANVVAFTKKSGGAPA